MEKFNAELINQVLNSAAKDYTTACKNHVVLSIWARVAKAFKFFMLTLPQQFKAVNRNKVRRYFMRRLSLEATAEKEQIMWNCLTQPATQQTREAIITI
jgi:hypothetical protein